ncbi:hypothetical protein [Paenibacillus durus]|uniref:Uncharacterized protein n=1 Tax=Paenibacillus durus ATCC 35681 TaxID=1333534 RepID=A0A0F7FBR0_PAEDU|nr:hypothetical protein [Paenibacillus durus]AKG36177.1 hypothetical protein VK70_17745 [Paenibacillus durus ATCC 35681]
MKIFSKKGNDNKQDLLSIEVEIDRRKEYKNISKHKRVLMPVIDWRISLYINGHKLYEDEVFVEDVYFKSLLYPGKYPMFTCTCGIFGCGGYYVNVVHNYETMIWTTQQSPFMERTIKSSNKFVFSWRNIIEFTEELIQRLEELKSLMISNKLEFRYDLEKYKDIMQEIKIKRRLQ